MSPFENTVFRVQQLLFLSQSLLSFSGSEKNCLIIATMDGVFVAWLAFIDGRCTRSIQYQGKGGVKYSRSSLDFKHSFIAEKTRADVFLE